MGSTISLLPFLLILPTRISFLPNPSESLRRKKKSWTTDGENQYFPFTQSTSHFVFLADNARSPRSRNFHSWQDNIDSEILSQMKVLENSIGISNPNWCGRVMLVWSIKVSHMLDSSPVSDSWQPPHTARAWWGGGTQGGMSSEDKGCRRGNKMAEFNASGVWQKFIERLKWSQELLAAMWDMWVPVFSNGINLGDGWAGKKF